MSLKNLVKKHSEVLFRRCEVYDGNNEIKSIEWFPVPSISWESSVELFEKRITDCKRHILDSHKANVPSFILNRLQERLDLETEYLEVFRGDC